MDLAGDGWHGGGGEQSKNSLWTKLRGDQDRVGFQSCGPSRDGSLEEARLRGKVNSV